MQAVARYWILFQKQRESIESGVLSREVQWLDLCLKKIGLAAGGQWPAEAGVEAETSWGHRRQNRGGGGGGRRLALLRLEAVGVG